MIVASMRSGRESMSLIDVTVPVRTGIPTYPADPIFRIERVLSMSEGGICNLSRRELGVCTGTHIDALVRLIDGAAVFNITPPDALIALPSINYSMHRVGAIDASAIDGLAIPVGTQRLLFKTRNSELWSQPSFSKEFVGITEDGARALVSRGVRLAGIDYLSIAPLGHPAPTHVALLSAGVVVLEGL